MTLQEELRQMVREHWAQEQLWRDRQAVEVEVLPGRGYADYDDAARAAGRAAGLVNRGGHIYTANGDYLRVQGWGAWADRARRRGFPVVAFKGGRWHVAAR